MSARWERTDGHVRIPTVARALRMRIVGNGWREPEQDSVGSGVLGDTSTFRRIAGQTTAPFSRCRRSELLAASSTLAWPIDGRYGHAS